MAQNLSLSFLAELCGVALNVQDSPADEIGIVNPVADSDLPGGDPVQITGPQLDNFEFRLSALNSTGLDVVKVRFIGQRKLYNNGTVKVVPLCIRRNQQANPSIRP